MFSLIMVIKSILYRFMILWGAYNEPVKDNKLTVNPSALSIIKPVTVKASEYDCKYQPDTHNGVDNSAGGGKYFNDIIVDKSVTNFI